VAEDRLQKIMARAGIASRRACEEIIVQKRVTVNGELATLGMKADPQRDDIRVDGARLHLPDSYDYIMLNKPRDVISDEDVGGNWPAARELIPLGGYLYPVGRLDIKSEGLMLFTNDGDLAHRLTHPRYEHPKTYHVLVEGTPSEKTLDVWRRGLVLDGQRTAPAEARVMRKTRDGALLEVTLREGRKRQIRRVAAALGHPVMTLQRVALGPLQLGDLAPGAWRRLTDEEVAALRAIRAQPRRLPRSAKGKPASAQRKPGRKSTSTDRSRGTQHERTPATKRGPRRK
jgi:23S rRNA pseudouridine2605 synthase